MPKKYRLEEAFRLKPGIKTSEQDLRERLYVITTAMNRRFSTMKNFQEKHGVKGMSAIPERYGYKASMTKIVDGKRVAKDYDELMVMFRDLRDYHRLKTSTIAGYKKVLLDSASDLGIVKKKGETIKQAGERAHELGLPIAFASDIAAIDFTARVYGIIEELKNRDATLYRIIYDDLGFYNIRDIITNSVNSNAKGRTLLVDKNTDFNDVIELLISESRELYGEEPGWAEDAQGLKF